LIIFSYFSLASVLFIRMDKKNKLCIIKSSEEYFFNEFNLAQEKSGIFLCEELKVYLLKLLSDNLTLDTCFDLNKPFSILFLEALNSDNNPNCFKQLKSLADHTLFLCGYFQESFNKKLVDIDFYTVLSKKAYIELYKISKEKIYYKIQEAYQSILDILVEMSFHSMQNNTNNLIKLYERWLNTGSSALEKKLNEKGILTIDKKIKVA
jgi:hypothetical protein